MSIITLKDGEQGKRGDIRHSFFRGGSNAAQRHRLPADQSLGSLCAGKRTDGWTNAD